MLRRPERGADIPTAHEERPAAVQDRWNGDQQLQPLLGARREEGEEIDAEDMASMSRASNASESGTAMVSRRVKSISPDCR